MPLYDCGYIVTLPPGKRENILSASGSKLVQKFPFLSLHFLVSGRGSTYQPVKVSSSAEVMTLPKLGEFRFSITSRLLFSDASLLLFAALQ